MTAPAINEVITSHVLMEEYRRLKTIIEERENNYARVVTSYAKAVREYSGAKEDAWLRSSSMTSVTGRQGETDNTTRRLKGEVLAIEAEMKRAENELWNVRRQFDALGQISNVANSEARLAGR